MKENSITIPVSRNNIHIMEEHWSFIQTIYVELLDISEYYVDPVHASAEIRTKTGKMCKFEMEFQHEYDEPDDRDTTEVMQEIETMVFKTVIMMKHYLNSVYIELGMMIGSKYFINLEINKENGAITVSSGELDHDQDLQSDNSDDKKPLIDAGFKNINIYNCIN